MWELIQKHFTDYARPLDQSLFGYMPNFISANISISMTLLGFPISIFSYEKISKKPEILYTITTSKTRYISNRETLKEKEFNKLLKRLIKQKYLFYITARASADLDISDFRSNRVTDSVKMNIDYHLLEEDALKIVGINLDSKKKLMPKAIYGVSKKGKLKLLHKANTKICADKEYWIKKGSSKE